VPARLSSGGMYLRRLSVAHCRSIEHVEIPFERDDGTPRMWTVLHGEGATCKTTLLRMIALAAAGPERAAALLGDAAAYRDPRAAEPPRIEARFEHAGAHQVITVELPASGVTLRHSGEPPGFVAAYGAGRALLAQPDLTDDLAYVRVAGVFGRWAPLALAFAHGSVGLRLDGAAFVRTLRAALIDRMRIADLVDLEIGQPAEPTTEVIARTRIRRDSDLSYYIKQGDVWAIPRATPGGGKPQARLIVKAGVEMDYERYLYFLDGDGDVARRSKPGGVPEDVERFTVRLGAGTITIPSTSLSHGQQAIVALVADLIGHAWLAAGRTLELDAITGLVLVDDLDLHVDARGQAALVPALAAAFPRVQFVATTRSPSILTACDRDGVWTLARDADRGAVLAAPWLAAMH